MHYSVHVKDPTTDGMDWLPKQYQIFIYYVNRCTYEHDEIYF